MAVSAWSSMKEDLKNESINDKRKSAQTGKYLYCPA